MINNLSNNRFFKKGTIHNNVRETTMKEATRIYVSCREDSKNYLRLYLFYIPLKRVKCQRFFVFTNKTTRPRPQVFSVNGALTCKNAAFLTSFPR